MLSAVFYVGTCVVSSAGFIAALSLHVSKAENESWWTYNANLTDPDPVVCESRWPSSLNQVVLSLDLHNSNVKSYEFLLLTLETRKLRLNYGFFAGRRNLFEGVYNTR